MVTVGIYTLAIAAVVAQLLVELRQEQLFKESMALMKAEGEILHATWERRKATVPAEVLEAIRMDPHMPAELRAELGAELVRRGKGALN